MYSTVYYSRHSNTLHRWEYNDKGVKLYTKDKAPLYFYVNDESLKDSEYKSIYGDKVKKVEFENYTKFREAKEMYKSANRKVFESDISVENRYIFDNWAGKQFEYPKLDIHFIDIEVHSEKGFPVADKAEHPITIITVYSTKHEKFFIFAEKEFDRNFVDKNGNKVLSDKDWVGIFKTETEMLEKFIGFIRKIHPDVISGWNSNIYDIPYIVNRCINLLGEKKANALSPIGHINKQTRTFREGVEKVVYEIAGINLIDYLDMYKKYNPKQQSSFKLDYIADQELGEKKLEFEGSLKDLYKNWQKYVEYNIQDVMLIRKLDKKLGFMNLMIDICYKCCVLFDQYEKTTKVLDGAFISRLMLEKIVVPDANVTENSQYEGAYVKIPIPDCYDWVVSYDATSLYPSIMMQHNISPETKKYKCNDKSTEIIMAMLEGKDENYEEWERNMVCCDDIICKDMVKLIKENKYSISTNGVIYSHNQKGIIARFVKDWFDKRQYHKKLQFECKKKGDKEGEKFHKGAQQIYKVLINSVYGYLGTPYSRFYEKDNAAAVTLTGQEIIKNGEKSINEFFQKWSDTEIGKKINAKNCNNVVIYSDTDSLYLHCGNILRSINYIDIDNIEKTSKFIDEKICKLFVKIINDSQQYLAKTRMNCPECLISFKREMICRRVLFLAKKHYVAWVIIGEDGPVKPGDHHEIEIKGMEAVRSSTPLHVRESLIEIYKKIIMSVNEKEVEKLIKEIYKELLNSENSDYSKISSANNIEKYTDQDGNPGLKCPAQVKGSIGFNKLIKWANLEDSVEPIFEGDKIKYVYIKGSSKFNNYQYNVISFKDKLPKEFGIIVDKELCCQKILLDPLEQFYDVMKWDLPSFDQEDITDLFG